MKNRLIILALGLSPPGTMGGNSKITIEMARCLTGTREVHFILPENKLATLMDNVPANHGINIHTIPAFEGDDKFSPIAAIRWFTPRLRTVLKDISAGSNDFLYCCSDFHVDVLPAYTTQKEFGFRWLPSVFLFVPFIFENLSRGYRFPAVKYLIYWAYQRTLFMLMKHRASGFVVTNHSDFAHFPKRFSGKLFDYYGGVNIEQIPTAPPSKCRDVVFCSRLHPQKGIDAFLDTWKLISGKCPTAKLSVIGNGDPAYERYLKGKANKLGIADTIEWLGYVNNNAKFRIYAQSRVFVHPTVFDNNGMVAAEALCTGLPVVMQDLPALRDVYTIGCLKVPFGDRDAFAAAVISLLTDPKKYTATAPTPDQLAALRARWNWESRAAEFDRWLDTLPCHNKSNVLSYSHAQGVGNTLHDRQPHDGSELHPFASRRECALSDLSRIRVLAEEIPVELLRAAQHGERTSVRALTDAIVSAAKKLSLYKPCESLNTLGNTKRRRSGESEIIVSTDNTFILKVKNPAAKESIKRTSPADWLYEHIIHNILFPDSSYEFIGVTEQFGSLRIILRQRNIEAVARPTDAQIAAYLATLGLKPEDRYFFGNDLLAVTDVGTQSDNVLLDDNGHLRFIDPLIRLKKPAIEIIEQLIGGLSA